MSATTTFDVFPDDDYAPADAYDETPARTLAPVLSLVPELDSDEDTETAPPAGDIYAPVPFPDRIPRAAQQALTDMGLGARIFIHLEDKAAFVTTPDGGEWRVYDGKQWILDRDEVEVNHLTRSVIMSIGKQEARYAADTDPQVLAAEDELQRGRRGGVAAPVQAKAQEKVQAMRGMAVGNRIAFGERCQDGLTHIKAATAAAKRLLTVPQYYFDAHPTRLNVLNGTIDITTKELHPHRAKDYFTKMAETNYIPGATHEDVEKILAFLDTQDPDLRFFMQRYFGLSTTALNVKRFLYLRGAADAGKTTLASAVARALGNRAGRGYGYSAVMSPTVFNTSSNQDGERARDNMHSLMGVRFLLMDEAAAGFPNVEDLKKAAAGGEANTRASYGKPITWNFELKIFYAGNDRMAMPDKDEGINKRLMAAYLPHSIPAHLMDTDLEDRMRQDPQREALLAWMVEGGYQVLAEGCNAEALHITDLMIEETAAYKAESDMLADFWEDNVREVPEGEKYLPLSTGQWHLLYTQYCKAHDVKPLSVKHLGERLTKKGFTAEATTIRYEGLSNKGRLRIGIASTLEHSALGFRLGLERSDAMAH